MQQKRGSNQADHTAHACKQGIVTHQPPTWLHCNADKLTMDDTMQKIECHPAALQQGTFVCSPQTVRLLSDLKPAGTLTRFCGAQWTHP
jgi:hypothetical protein